MSKDKKNENAVGIGVAMGVTFGVGIRTAFVNIAILAAIGTNYPQLFDKIDNK